MKYLLIGTVIAGAYGLGAIQRAEPETAAILTPVSVAAVADPDGIDLSEIYRVIRQVETGGHPDPANAVGDGGASLGPMQIGRLYFIDALEQDQALRDSEVVYDDVRNESIARRVMYAYWSRYATIPWGAEDLFRLHNGGPSRGGSATDGYWEKCKTILQEIRTGDVEPRFLAIR